jgi:type IV secretory pathway protease TraF
MNIWVEVAKLALPVKASLDTPAILILAKTSSFSLDARYDGSFFNALVHNVSSCFLARRHKLASKLA